MLELIYETQAKLADNGTSIDQILAMIIGLFLLIGIGYIVGLNKRENMDKVE